MRVNRLILIAAALLLIGALCYAWYVRKKTVAQVVDYTTSALAPMKRWTDKAGNNHAKVEAQQVPKAVFDHSHDSLIAEINKITKANRLLQATIVRLQAKDSIFAPYTDVVVADDTFSTTRTFAYVDPCVDISGVATDTGVSINYELHPTVTLVSHWQNPGLFKPKRLYTEAITGTCNQVDTMRTIVIQKPPKSFVETRGFAIGVGFLLGIAANMIKR